jgi:hypothetical protein
MRLEVSQIANPMRLIVARALVATVLIGLLSGSVQTTQAKHTISCTFDYDFRITPACSPKVTEGCVQQFNLYDISAGIPKRVKLGSIPVPAGASGFVKGISATTDALLFESGRHLLAVTAQMPNGLESDFTKCTTIVKIP